MADNLDFTPEQIEELKGLGSNTAPENTNTSDKGDENLDNGQSKGSDGDIDNKQPENTGSNEGPETDDNSVDEKDDSYYENENGDIVDSTGKVIIEKANVKYDSEGNVILPDDGNEAQRIQKALENELGVAFTNDNGEPIGFENTDEGVVEMVKTAAVQLQQQFEQELFESYPIAANLIRHMKAGKPIETFFNVSSQWRKTTIPADTDKTRDANKQLRKSILLEKEILSRSGGNLEGLSAEEINKIRKDANEYVEFIQSTGTDVEKAQEALKYLQQWEKSKEDARDAENRQFLEQQKQEAVQFWNEVKTTISSGNLNLVGIPKAERDAFFAYLASPVDKTGRTQEQIDMEGEDMKNRIFLSYLRFKKFNIDEVLKARILNEKANQLQGRKHKKVSVKFGDKVSNPKQVGFDGISLDKLIG